MPAVEVLVGEPGEGGDDRVEGASGFVAADKELVVRDLDDAPLGAIVEGRPCGARAASRYRPTPRSTLASVAKARGASGLDSQSARGPLGHVLVPGPCLGEDILARRAEVAPVPAAALRLVERVGVLAARGVVIDLAGALGGPRRAAGGPLVLAPGLGLRREVEVHRHHRERVHVARPGEHGVEVLDQPHPLERLGAPRPLVRLVEEPPLHAGQRAVSRETSSSGSSRAHASSTTGPARVIRRSLVSEHEPPDRQCPRTIASPRSVHWNGPVRSGQARLADFMTHPTSTANWSLVIHRVTATSVEVWVGTLFRYMHKPELARVCLHRDGREEATREIVRKDWKRPFTHMERCFYFVAEFDDLKENTGYRLTFERRIEANEEIGISADWQHLRNGTFRTLPGTLPAKGEGAFTIGLASCFYPHRDGGQAAAAYKALHDRGDPAHRPDITVLSGDQVYLDIGFDSLSFIPDEIRERIAQDYAEHWRELGSILSRGGTWMLPDDHEFWNDYPFVDSLIPTLFALKLGDVHEAWTQASLDAVNHIQRCPVVESFSFGEELTVCFADVRSYRTENGFLPNDEFDSLLAWARGRTSPAILVLSQPLIITRSRAERNLLSFGSQYAELLDALATSRHDIVVLSGDVHFGRIASVEIGNARTRLIEIVSSPLSNLTGPRRVSDERAQGHSSSVPCRYGRPTIGLETPESELF